MQFRLTYYADLMIIFSHDDNVKRDEVANGSGKDGGYAGHL